MSTVKNSAAGYVYLDHAATSPLRPEARAAMEPFGDVMFANPSGSHRFAREARRAIDEARDVVAAAIGCRPGEVVFTSGGTEGANTAVLGAVRRRGGRAVCPATEHHAVLHCVEHVGGVVVPVAEHGSVDPAVLRSVLEATDDVSVVSVMAVNNETGAITDMENVSHAVRGRAEGAILHTDAVQAACWIDLRILWPHVDVLTLSAHKFGGPKGVGVMVVREGTVLEPLMLGGGQERDRRSGTHNVAGIVGTAEALRVTDETRQEESARIRTLRDSLLSRLVNGIPCAVPTLPIGEGSAGTAHVCLDGLESESLLYLLDTAGVCVSAASACASGAMEPSHVLAAMNVPTSRINGSLRFSLGHTTSQHDIDIAVNSTVAAAERLLAVKP
jgi:cysteine desulfurase